MTRRIKLAITGAAGQIGYALVFRAASGEMFGPDTRVDLNLIELPVAIDRLKGVAMELEDCAFDTLGTITSTSSIEEGVADADWVLLVGSVPRGITINGRKIEERADLLEINGGVFLEQGSAIGRFSKPDAKILVVGNPANTNALIGKHAAGVDTQTWMAMMMLDSCRATAQLSARVGVHVSRISDVIVWGNHDPSMYPDVFNTTIDGLPAAQASDLVTEQWVADEYQASVGQRGKAVIDARGASSAASAANAALKTVVCVDRGEGVPFSVALPSTGQYGVAEGLVSGFPVVSNGGQLRVLGDVEHSEYAQSCIAKSAGTLAAERDAVRHLLV